jgi:hypothetical protein
MKVSARYMRLIWLSSKPDLKEIRTPLAFISLVILVTELMLYALIKEGTETVKI